MGDILCARSLYIMRGAALLLQTAGLRVFAARVWLIYESTHCLAPLMAPRCTIKIKWTPAAAHTRWVRVRTRSNDSATQDIGCDTRKKHNVSVCTPGKEEPHSCVTVAISANWLNSIMCKWCRGDHLPSMDTSTRCNVRYAMRVI